MARVLWCRFEDCRSAYVSQAGRVPVLCPACDRTGRWTTQAPTGDDPPPMVYTAIDRVILTILGIGRD